MLATLQTNFTTNRTARSILNDFCGYFMSSGGIFHVNDLFLHFTRFVFPDLLGDSTVAMEMRELRIPSMAALAPPSGQRLLKVFCFRVCHFSSVFMKYLAFGYHGKGCRPLQHCIFYWILAFNISSTRGRMVFHFLYIFWKLLKSCKCSNQQEEKNGKCISDKHRLLLFFLQHPC